MTEDKNNNHIPVLLNTITEFLQNNISQKKELIIFDGTFGGGGYTQEFLQFGHVIATDADKNAVDIGTNVFTSNIANNSLQLVHSRFDKGLKAFSDSYFDYIVADLGFSSNQLNDSNRGFSYQKVHEVLDLRYDLETGYPCWELLFGVKDVDKLRRIIFNNSGEALSKRIAEYIFNYINTRRINRNPILVGDIVEVITASVPAKEKRHINSILSRVWQALRIWTNNEFEVLEDFLQTAILKLKKDGCLVVVSFHSLEDKLITKFMRTISRPIELDDYGNKAANFELVTKKAVTPSPEEIEANPPQSECCIKNTQKADLKEAKLFAEVLK